MEASGPLNPNMAGELRPNYDTLPDAGLISSAHMPALGSETDYWNKWAAIDRDYELALKRRYGPSYADHLDPLRYQMGDLLREDQAMMTHRIDELTGASALREAGLGPSMTTDYVNTRTHKPERSPAGSYTVDPNEFVKDKIDPRFLTLSQQTQRFDHSRSTEGILAENYWGAGAPRPEVQKHLKGILENGLPQNVAFLDVESPGLNPAEGIWQASIRMPTGEDRTFHFPNAKMQWGGIMGAEAQPLEGFLAKGKPLDEYRASMKGLLQSIDESEWVGGHNLTFDYGMISRGLEQFKEDEELAPLIASFHSKFHNKSTGAIGNFIDTNVLARTLLPNIGLDADLRGGPTPHKWSLQNILLQTDLMHQVREKEGDERVNAWLAEGLHFANVDTPIEAHLYSALQAHQQFLKSKGSSGRELRLGSYLSDADRRVVRTSRAIGPSINMTRLEQLHPQLRARAYAAGLVHRDKSGVRDIDITPMKQMVALSRNMKLGARDIPIVNPGPSIMDQIRSRNVSGALVGLKRKLWDVSRETDNPLDAGIGTWARMSKGWVSPGGHITSGPSVEAWGAMQQQLAEGGIPLPGMSWIERHMASTLGQVGGNSKRERDMRSVLGGDVASLSRFIGPRNNEVNVVGKSKIAVVPMEFLEQWQMARVAGGEAQSKSLKFLHLSAFKHTNKTLDEVSLMAHLPEDEKASLLSFLMGHKDIGDDVKGELMQSFAKNTGTYGVQVGTLGDMKGGLEVSKVATTLRQIMGIGADRSDQTPSISIHYAGRDILGDEKRSAIYGAGAFMKTELFGEGEENALTSQVGNLVGMYQHYHSSTSDKMLSFYRNLADSGSIGEPRNIASDIDRYGRMIGKRAPLIAGAAALTMAGYYMHRRGKRNGLTDETFTAQPLEKDDWYERNRDNAIPSDPRQRPDYLRTASVVRNLDSNKINHTAMGADRHAYLFSTGY